MGSTRDGQTLGQQIVEKRQAQLEQAQVATMPSVDQTLPSFSDRRYSTDDDPVVGKEHGHQQAIDALRVRKVAFAQIETAPFIVRKASLD